MNQEQEASQELDKKKQQEAVITSLAAHCRKEWVRCRDAKQPIEAEMLNSLRQREGKYSSQKIQAIRTMGGSEIKMMLTDVKCRAAESIMHDILFGTGERPFSCKSTPIPEIPEDIMKIIKEEAYDELAMVIPGMIPDTEELRQRIDMYEEQLRKKAKE